MCNIYTVKLLCSLNFFFSIFLAKQLRAVYKNLDALIPANKRAFLGQFYSQVSFLLWYMRSKEISPFNVDFWCEMLKALLRMGWEDFGLLLVMETANSRVIFRLKYLCQKMFCLKIMMNSTKNVLFFIYKSKQKNKMYFSTRQLVLLFLIYHHHKEIQRRNLKCMCTVVCFIPNINNKLILFIRAWNKQRAFLIKGSINFAVYFVLFLV